MRNGLLAAAEEDVPSSLLPASMSAHTMYGMQAAYFSTGCTDIA